MNKYTISSHRACRFPEQYEDCLARHSLVLMKSCEHIKRPWKETYEQFGLIDKFVMKALEGDNITHENIVFS